MTTGASSRRLLAAACAAVGTGVVLVAIGTSVALRSDDA
jgi:hypothetical protein